MDHFKSIYHSNYVKIILTKIMEYELVLIVLFQKKSV